MFGETTISYVKIGNHPIETTIYKWLAARGSSYVIGNLTLATRSSHIQVLQLLLLFCLAMLAARVPVETPPVSFKVDHMVVEVESYLYSKFLKIVKESLKNASKSVRISG